MSIRFGGQEIRAANYKVSPSKSMGPLMRPTVKMHAHADSSAYVLRSAIINVFNLTRPQTWPHAVNPPVEDRRRGDTSITTTQIPHPEL